MKNSSKTGDSAMIGLAVAVLLATGVYIGVGLTLFATNNRLPASLNKPGYHTRVYFNGACDDVSDPDCLRWIVEMRRWPVK